MAKSFTFNKTDKVFIPALSTNALSITPVVELGITIAYTANTNGETLKFTVNGFEIDEKGNELKNIVAVFPATEYYAELLSELLEEEFTLEEDEEINNNSNILIADCLKFCKMVPCLFSNSVYNNAITLENCDCMGFVTEVPSAENGFKYTNIADGKKYEYAVLFDNNTGDTIIIA